MKSGDYKYSLDEIIKNFPKKKIVVIGDLMLDKYIYGHVSRISPEAPVPVVSLDREFYEIGGAGNVASNVASLGGEVSLFSFIGKDNEGTILKKLFSERKIDFFYDENEATIYKQRIVAKTQHLLRIDREEISEKFFSPKTKQVLLNKLEESDMIIISDYAKGAVTSDIMSLLKPYNSKMIVDPKPSNLSLAKNPELYKGVFLITPNEKESFQLSGLSDVYKAGEKIKRDLETNVIITRAEKGMMIFSDKLFEMPTYAKEAHDITGAGDSMIAAISLAISSGATLEQAAIIGSNTSAIAVEKQGTYSVNLNELEKRIFQEESKIKNLNELEKIIINEKRKGRSIVWTNGCFDIYGIGQKVLLEGAAKEGHVLVVGLDSDESIRKLKGPDRPINSEKQRAEILSSISYVDYITIFPPEGVKECLKILKPDIYVKGGDYTIDTIDQNERKIVESYRGKISLIGPDFKHHTTDIIRKIKGLE